jgi:hypothetical protein
VSFLNARPWCVVVVLAPTASEGCSQPLGKPAPDRDKLQELKTSELIDRLRDISDEGSGTHSTAWAGGFLAIDEEPRFHGGVLGSRKPAVSPVLRELVRRGVTALPELLEHVQDARPTKLVVGKDGFLTAMWHYLSTFRGEFQPRSLPWKNKSLVGTPGRSTPQSPIRRSTALLPGTKWSYAGYTLSIS